MEFETNNQSNSIYIVYINKRNKDEHELNKQKVMNV